MVHKICTWEGHAQIFNERDLKTFCEHDYIGNNPTPHI